MTRRKHPKGPWHGKTRALRKEEMEFLAKFPLRLGQSAELTKPFPRLIDAGLLYLCPKKKNWARLSNGGAAFRDTIQKLWGAQKERKKLEGEVALLEKQAKARDLEIGKLRGEIRKISAKLREKEAEFEKNAKIMRFLDEKHLAGAVQRMSKERKP